jgi:hypothetical protein
MNTPPDIDSLRKAALEELASLTTIEFGTLSEVYRNRPSPDGSEPVKLGPYTKHQCWENGKNRSTYIQAGHVDSLRQDLENGIRFQQITAQLANDAIQRSREQRLCSAQPDTAPTAEKKTSKPNVSPKNTAKRSNSSPKPVSALSNKRPPKT